jgi:hypothetical protein
VDWSERWVEGDVIDLATGQPVPNHDDVIWADEEAGQYCVGVRKEDGNWLVDFDRGEIAREVRSASLRIILKGDDAVLPDVVVG